jgi:recombination protein RecA
MAKDKDDDKKKGPVKLTMWEKGDKKAISNIVDILQDKFSDAPGVVTMNPTQKEVVLYPTGILSLDLGLGIGGLLGGRVVDCFGSEGTGKTLTGLAAAGSVQKMGGIAAFADAEGTFSRTFAEACGVDVENLILLQSTPDHVMTGEDFLEATRVLIAQGVNFIEVDSAAALVPSGKLQAKFGEGQAATHARMMSEELQKMTSYLSAGKRSIVWFTNQMRGKPMEMFGPKEEATGGNAIKFYASYRFGMQRVKDIIKKVKRSDGKVEEKIVGVSVGLRFVKNKTAPRPVEPITFDIYTVFGETHDGIQIVPGIDIIKDMYEVGKATGIVQQKGAWYQYEDVRGQGDYDFQEALRKTPEVAAKLRQAVLGIGFTGPVAATPEE